MRRLSVLALVVALGGSLLIAAPVHASHDGSVRDACPPGDVPSAGFSDVPPTGVHSPAIDCVVWWEVAKGTSGSTYAPSAAVNRAQMASFIARVLDVSGRPVPETQADHFTDDNGNPHEAHINRLAEAGIVGGLGDGRYGPGTRVSRAQMASFLVRAYEFRIGDALQTPRDHFPDDNGNPHETNINKAAEAGFASGKSSGHYDPSSAVTRAQMASFLARVLDSLVENGLTAPPGGASRRGDEPGADSQDPGSGEPVPIEDGSEPELESAREPADEEGLPTRDDDLVIHPAGTPVESDSENATRSIPPPDNGRPPTTGPSDHVMPAGGPATGDDEEAGKAKRLVYPGQPIFLYDAAAYLPYENLPTSVGQLEMWSGGQPSGNCTATVVERDLVLTAAHCVQNNGPAHDAYRFWPDRYGSQAKYGYWDAIGTDTAWLPTGWTMATKEAWRWAFDYALIKFPANAQGQHLGDVVGVQPVLMGTAGHELPKYAIGYPTEGWFSANYGWPWYCSADDPGQAGRYHYGEGYYSMGWGCDFNGGSSGGPVFAPYNGRWWVVSVNSTGGSIVECATACHSGRNPPSWYMQNSWGPDFHYRTDQYGFNAFWNAVTAQP